MTFNPQVGTEPVDLFHDADTDFSVWLGTEFQSHALDHIATIEGFLRAAYRAGWEAHKEEMQQQAMAADWRE